MVQYEVGVARAHAPPHARPTPRPSTRQTWRGRAASPPRCRRRRWQCPGQRSKAPRSWPVLLLEEVSLVSTTETLPGRSLRSTRPSSGGWSAPTTCRTRAPHCPPTGSPPVCISRFRVKLRRRSPSRSLTEPALCSIRDVHLLRALGCLVAALLRCAQPCEPTARSRVRDDLAHVASSRRRAPFELRDVHLLRALRCLVRSRVI